MVLIIALTSKFVIQIKKPATLLVLLWYLTSYQKRQKILAQLPSYTTLPPLAEFADTIARTYKTFGEGKAAREISSSPNTPKGKALAYAFLSVFGKAKEKRWKYSQQEVEFGEYLSQYAKHLLDAPPNKYTQSLQELITACGSTETIEERR